MMNQHAAASVAEPLSLKQWIFGAAASLRLRSSNETTESTQNTDHIVCSREYLLCALKIAHSLADQLSAVEEERGYKEMIPSSSRHCNNTPPITEMIDKSWSRYISVYCTAGAIDETKDETIKNTNDGVEGLLKSADHNFEPLPLSGDGGNNSEQPGDLQDLSQQLSTLLDNDNKQLINYLEVQGAILNEGAVDGRPLSADGRLEIRSLGIALYELFSGGRITAETGMSQQFFAELPTSSPLHSGTTDVERLSTEESESMATIGGGPSKKRPQLITSLEDSSQKMMARTQSASISVEPLKLLGLPTALCDLISNMIESGGGNDHDHGEAYEFISEVRDDLKLMIDSPNVYLKDIDLVEAANVGLQFGSSLFGREAELQALNECYQRSISSACEVAMICGLSGVGKSKLCEEFIQSLKEGGSIVLSGRCDKLHSQPLHAISSMFDEYCASLPAKDRSTAEKIAAALKEKRGDGISSLVAAIPNLANILGDNFDTKEIANDTVIDAQKRLHYLFSEFVGVISSCHDEPLIFFLDDCQWIDSASVALLNQIMMMTGSHNNVYGQGFFFGSYRDDEMSERHPLNLMLSSVDTLVGIKTTKIHLTPLSKGALNEMLSTALSLLPRITRPLADILHHKTKGSPLFVKQVIMELYDQRLLYPSLPRRRWVWETDKILDMKIPENVANLIAKSFGRLPSEVHSALVVLSCFGASADISMMEMLEREIQQPLISPLDDAVDHSVLGKRNGEFYFMHDKLQEAAYNMMKPEERCLHHNRYGLALGFVALRENNDRLLLSAVGQINQGGSQAVIDGDQAVVVANLNLDAGKIAMNMSDFFAAHSFFNHGISYLRRGHWEEHYDLSLALFNFAMKCALMNAEHESLKSLIDQVMQNTKCFEDRCQAISSTITLLTWSGNVPEAIELINSTLANLGEGLPTIITPNDIKHHLDSTKALLASLSDDALLNYPVMENPSKILAVELLAKQFQILPFVGVMAEAMPIIPFKTITISLTYGMCPLSPVAFAQYGNFLALVGYEFEEGYRYVKLALSLMNKLPSRAYDGSVMYHSCYTKLYVEPMQSAIEFYVDAYRASMKSGNPYSIGCSYVYDIFCFWSGKKLDAVVSSMEETIRESKHQKNFLLLTLMLPTFQMASRLMGQSNAPQQDDRVKVDDNTGNNVLYLRQGCFVRLTEALMTRDLNEARDAIDKYSVIGESAHCHFNVLTTPMLFVKFYCGLVSFWVCRETSNKNSSIKWLEKGVECKDEFEKLATLASTWNFQNKAHLLQAEEQFCRMDFEAAETLYDAAILASKTHKFVNEEALANELAGHFYLETGRKNRSVHYFSQAFEKYNEWGAVAKANMLTKYLIG